MNDDEIYMYVEFPLAMHISSILCNSPRHRQLDDLMEAFKPYLKEMYALHRRSKIKRIK